MTRLIVAVGCLSFGATAGVAAELYVPPAINDNQPAGDNGPKVDAGLNALLGHLAGNEADRAIADERWGDALPLLEQLVAEDPSDEESQSKLAMVRQKLDSERAAADYARSMSAMPDVWGSCTDTCLPMNLDCCGCDGYTCNDSPKLTGRFRFTQFYDDNPGAFPTTAAFNALFTNAGNSGGNLYQADLDYRLYDDGVDRVSIGGGIQHTDNYDLSQFDLLAPSAYIDAGHRFELAGLPAALQMRMGYAHTYLAGRAFLNTLNVQPALNVIVSDRDRWVSYYRYNLLYFDNQLPPQNSPFDADSNRHAFGTSWERSNACDTFTASVGYEWNHNEADGSDLDFVGHSLLIGGAWHPTNKWTVQAGGAFVFRDYKNPAFLFGTRRNDKNFLANVAVHYHWTEETDLFVDYTVNRNDSDQVFHDFQREVFQGGIEWRF